MTNGRWGLYCENRLGRQYWYIGYPRVPDMRVGRQVLDLVFFLCGKNEGEDHEIGGTGFAIAYEEDGIQHPYLVTARHCITRARDKYSKLFLRLNRKHGGEADYVEVPFNWATPEDPAIDLAVLPAPPEIPSRYQVTCQPSWLFASLEVVGKWEIGIGDSVLIIGLFSKRAGRKRNVPIVRTGTIAAMPDEPLTDSKSGLSYNAFLLEVRSIGGLSGSPVIAYLGYDRDELGRVNRKGQDFLLGVVRGHWDYKPSDSTDGPKDEREESEAVNMGIAIATPTQDLIDLLSSEELVKQRKEKAQKVTAKDEPTLDWEDGEGVIRPDSDPNVAAHDVVAKLTRSDRPRKKAAKKASPPKHPEKSH